MEDRSFDRLVRRFGTLGTRRNALSAAVGAALAGATKPVAAQKGNAGGGKDKDGKGKGKGRGDADTKGDGNGAFAGGGSGGGGGNGGDGGGGNGCGGRGLGEGPCPPTACDKFCPNSTYCIYIAPNLDNRTFVCAQDYDSNCEVPCSSNDQCPGPNTYCAIFTVERFQLGPNFASALRCGGTSFCVQVTP